MKKLGIAGVNKWVIGLFIIFFLIILFPLFRSGMPVTDDGDWMIIRLSAFYQTLAEGQFPPRFLGRLNQSFGYPVANFLYPGFLYIGSILHKIGLSFVDSVKTIMISSILIGGVSAFLWLKTFFRTKESFLGVCIFILSPYLFYDLYTRGSVGEIVATGTFFLILFLTEGGYRIVLPPVIAFLIISHNTYALFYLCFYVVYCIIRKQWKVCIPLLLGFLMASFFWLPALIERSFVIFHAVSVSNPFHYFTISNTLLLWGLPALLMVIYIATKNDKSFYKERCFFVIVFLLASFFASSFSSLFWNIPILGKLVQFPYRFLGVWFISLPWLFAWFLTYEKNKQKKYAGVLFILVVFLIYIGIRLPNVVNVTHPEGYYSTNEGTTTVGDEYMPKWVFKKPEKRESERLMFFSGTGKINIEKFSTQTIDAHIVAKEDSIMQVNTVFYPGWGAMLDGKPIEIEYKNQLGVMRIFVPKGEHQLLVQFRETVFRFMTDIISFVGIVLFGIYALWNMMHSFKIKKPKKNKKL